MTVPASTDKASPDSDESMGDFLKRNAKKLVFSGVPWACEGLGYTA